MRAAPKSETVAALEASAEHDAAEVVYRLIAGHDWDSARWQKPATYRSDPARPHPLHSEVDCEVFPCKPEEIHDSPSRSVVAESSQRSQVQILPPLQRKPALISGNAGQGRLPLPRGFEPTGQKLARSRVDDPMTLRDSPRESDRGHADLRRVDSGSNPSLQLVEDVTESASVSGVDGRLCCRDRLASRFG